jgi:cytosine/adenosine deaminase-related metal-dependent hydrolase
MARKLFKGARLLHLDPVKVEVADVRIDGSKIVQVGADLSASEDEVVDVAGKWVMPGLVCGHHHLYSALACGMPLPTEPLTSFTHMLEEVWWTLDVAHDEESTTVSGLVGGVGALKSGVTTVIDHHASPRFIEGSLEVMDLALGDVGLRRVLCYEVTDRNDGDAEAAAGLKAHEALLKRGPTGTSAVMVGGHASFTMSDDTLSAAAKLARAYGVGLHIHVAEAVDDARTTGEPLIDRYERLDALLEGSLFAHCVHLSDDEMKRMGDAGVRATHQARSNMNNGVGHARIDRYPVGALLGTDGIGADMIGELQAAYFRGAEANVAAAPADYLRLLTNNAVCAGDKLGVKLGKLEPGYEADVVVLDPVPGPPLTAANLAAAFIFRFGSQMVRDVYVGGERRLADRGATHLDEAVLDARAQRASEALWARMLKDREAA